MRSDINQVCAVIVGHDAHALGEHTMVELLDLLADALQRGQRLLAASHQDDTLDDIVLLVFPHPSQRDFGADAHVAQLLDIDRRTVLGWRRHRDIGNVLGILKETDTAHVVALHSEFQVVGANIRVAVCQRR